MDKKFKDFFTVLCTNNIEKYEGGDYVMPVLSTCEIKKPDPETETKERIYFLNPVLNEKSFLERLEQFWGMVDSELEKYPYKRWDEEYEFFAATLREIFFNDYGFLVPWLGAYVNAEPQKQEINQILWVPAIRDSKTDRVLKRQPLPVTDFDKDPVFECFARMLFDNMAKFETVLYAWKKAIGGQISEKTHEINEDNKGLDILAEPFKKEIDKLLNSQEKRN